MNAAKQVKDGVARVEEGSETLLRCTLAAGVEDTAMA